MLISFGKVIAVAFSIGFALVYGTWRGPIDDCESCSVETIDSFNNLRFYPRLASLLNANYFRFYRIDFTRPCRFWADNNACASKSCAVKACSPSEVPNGIRSNSNSKHSGENSKEKLSCGQLKDSSPEEPQDPLGFIDKTLEPQQIEAFRSWRAYDEALYDFCELDDSIDPNNDHGEFVDLTLNPERFTGYKGESAAKIWRAIYSENCFKSERDFYFATSDLNHLCTEQRVFFRLVSGLHTSITVHLCAKYYNKISEASDILSSSPTTWGPNFEEFKRRFDNRFTGGQGAARIRNLYLLYLVELRALVKIAPFLEEQEVFFTGDEAHDEEVRHAVHDLLQVAKSFPNHFDEKALFDSLSSQSQSSPDLVRLRLRDEFRDKFRNISRIMACVGCDKCKLWGTLQTHGLGTALKILFWPEDQPLPQLRRQEIVALFNAIGRLSTSIRELEVFSHILNAEYNQPEQVQEDPVHHHHESTKKSQIKHHNNEL